MHFGIIAAGEGSRLAGEGVTTFKPLLPLKGQPMIGRLIRIMGKAGAESVSVVVNAGMPAVADYLESFRSELSVPLKVKIKSTPSSMHTFYELCRMFPGEGRFVATTVDTVFREENFFRYVMAFRSASDSIDGMMAVTDFIEDEKPLYVETGDDHEIKGFLDGAGQGCRYISGGVYGLGYKAVEVLTTCMERGVERMRNYQRALLDAGLRLKAFPMGKIIDIDHASDLKRAEEFLSEL